MTVPAAPILWPLIAAAVIADNFHHLLVAITVLIASGHAKEEVLARFASETPDAFLGEPFHAEALVAKVREILSRMAHPTSTTIAGGPHRP